MFQHLFVMGCLSVLLLAKVRTVQPVDPRIVAQLNLLRRRSLCSCRLASCRALWILNCTTSSEFRRLRLKMNLKRYVNATVK